MLQHHIFYYQFDYLKELHQQAQKDTTTPNKASTLTSGSCSSDCGREDTLVLRVRERELPLETRDVVLIWLREASVPPGWWLVPSLPSLLLSWKGLQIPGYKCISFQHSYIFDIIMVLFECAISDLRTNVQGCTEWSEATWNVVRKWNMCLDWETLCIHSNCPLS